MRCLSAAVCLLLVSLPGSVMAWSNHSLGSALALQGLTSMQQAPAVKVEALEDFLRSEAPGLQVLLDQQEAFALANFPGYPARPAALRWQVDGEGERQRDFLKALPPVPECWFTVVMPDYGVSTPEAFAAYDRVGSSIHPDCGAQEAAIRAGDLDALCAAAGNALEECSGAKDTGAIKALLREHGAVTALMTGSGAAVFGVFRDEGAARAAAQAAKRRWKQVYVAQPDRGGARVSR